MIEDPDLFKQHELKFFAEEDDRVRKYRQDYYNCLADCVISGTIYIKSEKSARPLTDEEVDDIIEDIGIFLNSLN